MSKKICFICRTRVGVGIHHILPQADGGDDSPINLVSLCSECHDYVEIHTSIPRTRADVLAVGMERIDVDSRRRRCKNINCDRPFTSLRKDQVYCSHSCRVTTSQRKKRLVFEEHAGTDEHLRNANAKPVAPVAPVEFVVSGVPPTTRKTPKTQIRNVNVSRDILASRSAGLPPGWHWISDGEVENEQGERLGRSRKLSRSEYADITCRCKNQRCWSCGQRKEEMR